MIYIIAFIIEHFKNNFYPHKAEKNIIKETDFIMALSQS